MTAKTPPLQQSESALRVRSPAIFLTVESPFPATDPQRRWEAQIVEILSEHFELEVLCLGKPQNDGPPSQDHRIGDAGHSIKVTWVDPKGEGFIGRHALKKTLSQLKPGQLRRTYSVRMEQALRERYSIFAAAVNPTHPKPLIWISRLAMAQYAPLVRRLGYQVVLDKQAAESDALMDDALSGVRQFFFQFFRATQTHILEREYCSRCEAVVMASELQASRMLKLVPGAPVFVVPRSVDVKQFTEMRTRPGEQIGFYGDLSEPETVVGLTRFVEKVLPRLRAILGAQMPEVLISGPHANSDWIARMVRGGVQIYPPEKMPSSEVLQKSAVVIMPAPHPAEDSAQTVLEAMAAGRAVVSTVRALEGLVLSPGYDIWIAEKKDQFASVILRLLRDTGLREMTGLRAAETVDSRYDLRATRVAVEQLLFSLRSRTRS